MGHRHSAGWNKPSRRCITAVESFSQRRQAGIVTGHEETHRGILVGVDRSTSSMAAVNWAARDAAMRNVALTLMHVIAPVVPAVAP